MPGLRPAPGRSAFRESAERLKNLRAAIASSGKSQYRLAKETGLSQGRISTFLAGGDLTLTSAAPLAAAVGLVLAAVKPPSAARGKK